WMRRVTTVPDPDGKAPLGKDFLVEALQPGLMKIAERLRSTNLATRQATLDFLEMMGDAAAPALPYVVEALSDYDHFVRWQAARILGKIGPVRTELSVPALARLLNPKEDPDVRDQVANTLYLYGWGARAALPALVAAVAQPDSETRESAIRALLSVGPE